MRISDRFIDNGVIGGFFLAGQFILLALWGLTGWIQPLTGILTVSGALQSTVNALLAALGISGIFFFGLLLDLLTTRFLPFVQAEIIILSGHLHRNEDWLPETIEKEDAYLKKGDECFKDAYDYLFREKKYSESRNLYIRLLELLRRRDKDKSDKEHQDALDLEANYYRLRYFFNSYVLLNSGISQLDTLTDQVHWWRASRAICIATVIWAFEPLIVLLIWLAEAVFFRLWLPDLTTVVAFILSWFVLILLPYLTFRMTNTAFARMCHTLFSLARVTYVKKKSDHSSIEQQKGHTP